ncbi:DUF1810 domain-containing protein [Labrys monachus]|uniref:Uncharacterized protein (DUF1810 family) n=1 Tax=Labrys monachus TaxID=217067 RepID=A0ABU0FGR3_9HYPH|nr:DUF1810 domain-containing protein [Labrys monachus]MDQ0393314.1 uncharacterized protein (DUF1810 family) [Labrys monachus]
MTDSDPFDLERFVTAQASVFDTAIEELKGGRKRSHWMWFVFPQLRGLGRSPTATFYGIASLDEARAYLGHALLGPRLHLATDTTLRIAGRSLNAIFGSPDDIKFHSSMTLFAVATGDDRAPFSTALDRWCGGRMDGATLALLGMPGRGG